MTGVGLDMVLVEYFMVGTCEMGRCVVDVLRPVDDRIQHSRIVWE
jgi:hypothetical protein